MSEKENKIGQDFTFWGLLFFVLPSFFTNLLAQLFKSLDDALFISRYVGATALGAISLLNPLSSAQMAFEHLFSLGSSNISAKLMGEGRQDEAKKVFTRICITSVAFACLFALFINIFSKQILLFLGADEEMMYYATTQLRFVFSIAPIAMLNRVFSCYFSTAGKPRMGLYCSIINGVFNIGLDIILVAYLKMGVIGACIATIAGEVSVFIFGLAFFINRKNEIYFVKVSDGFISTSLQSFKYALPQCLNTISFAITSYIANIMILKVIGSIGISANAVVTDVRKILTSGLIGVSVSMCPVVAYNVGSKQTDKLKRVINHFIKIWAMGSVLITTIGLLLRRPLISLFLASDTPSEFYDLTFEAMTIEMFTTPFSSGNIAVNRLFIALGNARIATISSIFRNLISKSIMFILLPNLLGAIGIWLSVPISEVCAFILCVYLLVINADNYGYGKSGNAYLIHK